MGEGGPMSQAKPDERRHRRRPLHATAAAVSDGELLFRCRIVDVSEGGAHLEMGDGVAPDRFQLIDVDGGSVFSVRVVWRRAHSVGVAFLYTRAVDAPGTPEWIAQMWRGLKSERPLGRRSAAAA